MTFQRMNKILMNRGSISSVHKYFQHHLSAFLGVRIHNVMSPAVTTLQNEKSLKVNVLGDDTYLKPLVLNALEGKSKHIWREMPSNKVCSIVTEERYDLLSGLTIPSLDVTLHGENGLQKNKVTNRMKFSDDINTSL